MSFKCNKCGVAQPDHVKPVKVVTETRPAEYYHKDRDFYTYGTETVRELVLCQECANA